MQLYENIKRRRNELNMTQTELAQKTGYSDKSMIAKIEKGVVDIPISKIDEFARALLISPGDLMGNPSEKSTLLSEEQEFISKYRHLDATDKVKVESYTDGLLSQEKYTAPRSSEGVS